MCRKQVLIGTALLAAGAVYGASALDQPEYIYSRADNSIEELELMPNSFYVRTPKRELLEHALRLNPVQPVYEYNAWYFAQDAAADGRLKAIAEYDALAGVQLTELGQKSARHLARIRVLPI